MNHAHHDDAAWRIMMIHLYISWCYIMMNHDDSPWWIMRIHHDDASWWVMMFHHDESWWFITMNHHATLKGLLSGGNGPFCHGCHDIFPRGPFCNAAFLPWLPWDCSMPRPSEWSDVTAKWQHKKQLSDHPQGRGGIFVPELVYQSLLVVRPTSLWVHYLRDGWEYSLRLIKISHVSTWWLYVSLFFCCNIQTYIYIYIIHKCTTLA